MNKPRCLIADKMHESITPLLEEAGFTVDYKPEITRENLLQVISDYTGLIIRSKTEINSEVIDMASSLRFIGRAGAGIDQLDVALLKERDIKIFNAPEGNRDALGEHTIGMLLCLFNKINLGDLQIRKGIWDREGNRGVELMGKTVGLIGYGNMGQAFAKRLSSFDCKVIAYDKYHEGFVSDFAKSATMEEIYHNANILSLHIPLTAETRGMFKEDYLDKFRQPFYLINTARGEIAPFSSIYYGLSKGKILGAALDVLENEKLDKLSDEHREYFTYLTQSEKVVMTPHVAGWTYESYKKINEVLVGKIKALKLM